MSNTATVEQKYDLLLASIFKEWYDARQDYELNRNYNSFSVSSALMRILCETATSQDIVDYILTRQQLEFLTTKGECNGEKAS